MILPFALLFTIVAQVAAVLDFDNAPEGAHFAKGAGEPVCTVSGLTVSCTGTAIEGVGHTDATVTLDVTSTISGVCHNPGVNSKIVEPFSKSITTETSANLFPTRNGRLDVPLESATGTGSDEFLATFTCPNPNWTPEVTSNVLTFIYTLTFDGFPGPFITITG
jgi:hypothetical protein